MNFKCAPLFSSVAFISLASCANSPLIAKEDEKPRTSYTEEQDGRHVTNAAANEMNAHNFVEIEFPNGSAVLSKSATNSLDATLAQAKQKGKMDEVMILSWADEEFPSQKLNKLPKAQITLADRRNNAIKDYLRSVSGVSTESYNMAERPNVFSKWFNTTDTKLKNSLVAAGLPTTADKLQYPSKASHAIVLVKVQ